MAIRLTGLVSGMDTESLVKELMNAERMKSTKVENKITKLEWTQEKWKTLNTKIYSFYTGALSKARMESSFLTKKAASSNTDKLEVTAGPTAPEGTHKIKIKSAASAQFVTGAAIETNGKQISGVTKLAELGITSGEKIKFTVGGAEPKEFVINNETTIADFTKALKDAGLNANFDSTHKRFFISSKESGLANQFTIENVDGDNVLSKLGLNEIVKENGTVKQVEYINEAGEPTKLDMVAPTDAKIIYNGAELTSSSNNMTVNGLTFTIKGTTLDDADPTNDEISISINSDTQAVYDMAKDFIKTYNELLKEMNDSYYADHARGYDPLTDDERKAMSEDQIEKWEGRIKASLLRRDSSLSTVMNAMKSAMGQRVSVNGKNYSLASFGINAVDYTEKGILHINGDSEDTLVGLKNNELEKALTEDPETVMKVFTELARNLYTTMGDQMKSTTLSSALTFYNDKQMKNTLDDYKDNLSDLERKLLKVEDRYYKQFAAMEKALAQMNSQSSSIMSLLGMNTGQ